MSITYLHKSEINHSKWDETVGFSSNGSVYGLSWYLDAVADDWHGLVLDDYEAVLPLVTIRKKGVNIIYQPFFTRYFEVYGKEFDDRLEFLFLQTIPSDFKLVNFCLLSRFKKLETFDIEYFNHQQLNLEFNYESLFSAFSTNAKRLIKKAKKNAFTITATGNIQLLIDLFKTRKGDQLNFTDENYRHMNQLMSAGLKNGHGKFYEAFYNDTLIAVAYFFEFNNRIYYFNGSITEEGKREGGLYFIINQIIEDNCESNKVLDFGGSKVKEVADFYKKFGASDVEYTCLSKNDLNWMLKKVKQLRDKIKK